MSCGIERSAGRRLATIAGVACAFLAAAPASAQELTQTFINPSFGGNPFYSDHLLGIANIDRPDEPTSDDAPTAEELLVSQLRAQLTSTLSSDILRRIQAANEGPFVPGAPGNTGDFTVGDQRVSFVRGATETRVTFVNGRTGETTELVIPVSPSTTPSLGLGTQSASAEQLLTARPSAPLTTLRSGRSVALFGTPLGQGTTPASAREGLLLAPPPLQ